MEPEAIGRPVFYLLPLWLVVVFYLSAAVSLGVFFWGVYRRLRKYLRGRQQPEEAITLRRMGAAIISALTNRTILRGNIYAGLAHLVVFWGFGMLFLATLMVLVDNDILKPLAPQWRFLTGTFYLWFSWAADLFGVLLLAGLVMFAVRRGLLRPPQLQYRSSEAGYAPRSLVREDWIFLTLLVIVGIGGFSVEALRIRATEPAFERVSFAGWSLAQSLAAVGLSAQAAQAAFPYTWSVHAVTALVLVAYIPHSKAWHMLAGWFSLAMKGGGDAGTLPREVQGETRDYARIEDFSRGELVMLDACTRCGRCHAACPAATAGFPLSPRDLVLALRTYVDRAASLVAVGGRSAQPQAISSNSDHSVVLAGGVIPSDWLWSCAACLSCVDRCPTGVQPISLIVQMRRTLVAAGEVEERLQAALTNLSRYGNSQGQPPRGRPRWAQGLEFPISDARKEPAEYLWFVGDYASYDPRVQRVTRAAARVFHRAGITAAILYEDERNAGNDVRRVGEEGLFDLLREKNMQAVQKAQCQRVVTTDPHTYHVLKNEYPALNGGGVPVLHAVELLDEFARAGRLPIRTPLHLAATYHDPCYLGRYNGVYMPPRRLLQSLGVTLVEMPRNRQNSYCCGAGGGRIWMEETPGIKERPAESRVREAASVPGVTTLVVACPKDHVMFSDALKTTGLEGKIAVKDVIELVEEATAPPEGGEAHAGSTSQP